MQRLNDARRYSVETVRKKVSEICGHTQPPK